MASSTNGTGGSNVDQIRYQSYLTQMERQQDADIKDLEEKHKEKLSRTISLHDQQENVLHKDYDVKISEEADSLEKKLSTIRERNTAITTQERNNGELEANKIRTQYQQKIDQERKNGDEQIAKLHQYYQKATEEMARQYAKDADKEKPTKGKV